MMSITRRALLRSSRRAIVAAALMGTWSFRAKRRGRCDELDPSLSDLHPLGRLKTLSSREISTSRLSVGFEVLDRQLFDPERTYDHLLNLGVKWARCQTGWNRCERAKGQFSFEWLDDVVNSLLDRGIQPWFNLGYGNKLYIKEKPDDMSVGWVPLYTQTARQGWIRFVDKLAAHFSDRVRHWEIWNEPNIRSFWKPKPPNAADYVELVKITAPVIRRHIPKAVIIGGALAGIPTAYVKACLKEGLASLVDRISYHPYRAIPEQNYETQVKELRRLITAHSSHIALWQGENGCPSRGGPESTGALSHLDWDEQKQAKWLLRRILSDLRLDLELTSYFHTVDLVGYRGKTNFKGLLRGTDYTPKPAYFAYQSLCTLFGAPIRCVAATSQVIDGQKTRLVDCLFDRDGYLLYAWWAVTDLFKPWSPKRISVQLEFPKPQRITGMILVDPLRQRVYRLSAADQNGNRLELKNLPLLDYPLLVADERLVRLT